MKFKFEDEHLFKSFIDAFRDSLEGLFFADVDEFQKVNAFSTPKEEAIISTVQIKSPFKGAVTTITPQRLAREFCQDALDNQEDFATELLQDLMNEFTNTVTGNFLTRIFQGKRDYDLSIPTNPDLDTLKNNMDKYSHRHFFHFLIQDKTLNCVLSLNP